MRSVAPRPGAAPRRTLACVLLLAALAAGCGPVSGSGSKLLAVSTPRWAFSHLPLRIRVEPRGLLAKFEPKVTVAVGPRVVGRWPTHGKPTSIWIPGHAVVGGRIQVAVKCGTERTNFEVQVIPSAWLVLPTALAIALGFRVLRRPRTGG